MILMSYDSDLKALSPEQKQLNAALLDVVQGKKTLEDIEAGGDVNIRDSFGSIPLIWAAMKEGDGRSEVVTFLLDSGADIGIVDEKGRTVWDYVSENESLQNTEAFYRIREASLFSSISNRALFKVLGKGEFKEIIQVLDKGIDVNDTDIRGLTPLMAAIENQVLPRVLNLRLDQGALVNKRGIDNKIALIYAAERGENPEYLSLLLEAGGTIL